MKARYILFAIVALAVSACVKDNSETPEAQGVQMTITAYQEGSEMTRTAVQNGGTQVFWEPSDEVKVFFKGSSGRFISQNTENVAVTDFVGTISLFAGANEGANSSNLIWGLYPYRADATFDGSSVTTTLPSEQVGRAGSFAKNTQITLAQSGGLDLAFYNVCGGLRFSLTQEGIERVSFKGNEGESLAGKIKLTFEEGIPVVSEVYDRDSVLTITPLNGGTFQAGQWYYLSVLPATLTRGFKLTFYRVNEAAELISNELVIIKRGIFGSLAEADKELTFSPCEEHPSPNAAIHFEDPVAKYACVEKFDTDGDGEVSYDEAATVTSLQGLFADWNTVKTFEEIRYFTGVSSTKGVFDGLPKLTHITIPENIIELGSFQGCGALETVVLPETILSLPWYCFRGCVSLKEIDLPKRIKVIPRECFASCEALKSITLSRGVSLERGAFQGCTSLSSVVLPDDLTVIPDYCFSKCYALAVIAWPQALTTIGEGAFSDCLFENNGYSLELPSTVKTVGHKAFGGLHHLVLPSTSLITIENDSFVRNCTFLYVPDFMVEIYQIRTNWSNLEDRIRPISGYPEVYSVGGTIGEAVDLGLSVKWSSWNLGASSPEEYGVYLAWGMVEPAPYWGGNYSSSSYYYYFVNGIYSFFKKYNSNSTLGHVDYKTVLDLNDDAAHIQWKGTWRIPTQEDFGELLSNCETQKANVNGVDGVRFISRKAGFNDVSIFFPIAGKYDSMGLRSGGGNYWSSSVSETIYGAERLDFYYTGISFNQIYIKVHDTDRWEGLSIRPVCD